MIPPLIVAMYADIQSKGVYSQGFPRFFLANIAATTYCTAWDFYMDWGLIRSRADGKYLLRDNIIYEKEAYYIAMVINFCLRYVWVMSFVTLVTDKQFGRFHLFQWFLMFAEIIRRTLWSLFRIEWELINVYPKSANIHKSNTV